VKISIGLRLAGMVAVVFVVATGAVCVLGLLAVRSALLGGANRELDEELVEVAREIDERTLTLEEFEAYLASIAVVSPFDAFFRVTRLDGGEVVASSAARSALLPRLNPPGGTVDRRTLRIEGDEHRHLLGARRFETRALGPVLVEVALRLRAEEETMRHLAKLAIVASPLLALTAGILGLLVARRALRPIDAIDRAARTIGAGPAGARLPRPGTGDELDRLTETLNAMLVRLEAASSRNLHFAGDVAHEVRTPLATVRLCLEGAIAGAGEASPLAPPLEAALAEVGHLEALIRGLLLICRADEGQLVLARSPVDLSAVARESAELFGPLAESRGMRVGTDAVAAARVEGDPALLRRLVANLVDNAVRYSEEGGEILVRVFRDGARVRLEVADRGPGIDPAAREKVFERFYRSQRARAVNPDGSGLGLALVLAVARAHGGGAAVAPRPGGGSIFSVELQATDGSQTPAPLSLAP
jgi:heavy metal sensor kinase